MWYSCLEYKILRNEWKEWKKVFLHENRLLTNLLNSSGKKEWIIICKTDKLYVELSCCIFLPVIYLIYTCKEKPILVIWIFSQVCCTVFSMNIQFTAVRMGLAFKRGQSPQRETPVRTQMVLYITQRH